VLSLQFVSGRVRGAKLAPFTCRLACRCEAISDEIRHGLPVQQPLRLISKAGVSWPSCPRQCAGLNDPAVRRLQFQLPTELDAPALAWFKRDAGGAAASQRSGSDTWLRDRRDGIAKPVLITVQAPFDAVAPRIRRRDSVRGRAENTRLQHDVWKSKKGLTFRLSTKLRNVSVTFESSIFRFRIIQAPILCYSRS